MSVHNMRWTEVVINDNCSGAKIIDKDDMRYLVAWCKRYNIDIDQVVIDEQPVGLRQPAKP